MESRSTRVYKLTKNSQYTGNFDYFSYLSYRYNKLFFRSLIFRGKKLWAFKFFQDVKYELKKREGVDPFWVFLISMIKITPDLLLFKIKLGGVIQEVPLPINERKQVTFAVKWVIKVLKDKNRKISLNTVTDSLVLAIYSQGDAIQKRMEYYSTGLSNRHLLKFFK